MCVVPAFFSVMCSIYDVKYLPGNGDPENERLLPETQHNINFFQISSPGSLSDIQSQRILASCGQCSFHKRKELYEDRGGMTLCSTGDLCLVAHVCKGSNWYILRLVILEIKDFNVVPIISE